MRGRRKGEGGKGGKKEEVSALASAPRLVYILVNTPASFRRGEKRKGLRKGENRTQMVALSSYYHQRHDMEEEGRGKGEGAIGEKEGRGRVQRLLSFFLPPTP